jgi:hypothetical protein
LIMTIQFDFFIICLCRESKISYFEHKLDRISPSGLFGIFSIETLMGLSKEIVNKVFIIENLLFTITKWVQRSGDSKIVNLNPFYKLTLQKR